MGQPDSNVRDKIRAGVTGPIGSLRTPFNRDGSIDHAGVRSQIDFILAHGGKATLITAGDSHLGCMADDEILELHRTAAEHTAGRALLIGADWEFATPQALPFAREIKAMGFDIFMIRPPDWAQSSIAQTIVEHFRAVSEVMPVMVVTNIFAGRPEAFGLKVLRALLDEAPGVMALKEDLQNEFARRSALLTHKKWAVFSGGGLRNHLNMLPYGCDGFMDRHMNFAPSISMRYWDAIQKGDTPAAMRVIEEIELPLEEHMAGYPGGRDAAVHGLMELAGVCGRWRKPPYYSLSDAEMERLRDFARGMKVL